MWGLKNVLINGETLGAIAIDNGTIEGIFSERATLPEFGVDWKDGKGLEAYPAGIDMHVHDRWGEPDKEDPDHLEAAAIDGGVGTIVMMGNTKPPYEYAAQTPDRMSAYIRRPVKALAWISCTRTNRKEREQAFRHGDGRIKGGKLMMASTNNPETLVDDEPSQLRILEENANIGCTTTAHAEAEDWFKRSRVEYEKLFNPLTVHQHCDMRNGTIATEGIRRILELHRQVGAGHLHICHVSTAEGIRLVMDAKMRGQQVTAETCPHYWEFSKHFFAREGALSGRYKMNPALSTSHDQWGIREHLLKGDIDTVATDHAPHEWHLKLLTGIDECPSGVPGVQNMMQLTYEFVLSGDMTRKQFINLTSRNAANILGLNKGCIHPGYDADIVLIDSATPTTFTDEDSRSKCGWTPYHQRVVSSTIRAVILGGKVVKPLE